MSKSFSKSVRVECGECHTDYPFDVWLIVDASERPDLLEKCRDGSIHIAACPEGHQTLLKAPLLLHIPPKKQIIFSPPLNYEQEIDFNIARELTRILHQKMSVLSKIRRAVSDDLFGYPNVAEVVFREYLSRKIDGAPIPSAATPGAIPVSEELAGRIKSHSRYSLRRRLGRLAGQARLGHQIDLHFLPKGEPVEAENVYLRAGQEGSAEAAKKRLRAKANESRPPSPQLRQIFAEIQRHPDISETPLRISLWKQASRLVSPEENPEPWATVYFALGQDLCTNPQRDPATYLDEALRAFETALSAFTRQDFPYQWALALQHIGTCYLNRTAGDRSDNFKRAKHAYEAALTVFSRESNAANWAYVSSGLAEVYLRRQSKNLQADLEMTIRLSEAALTVFTREGHAEQWALTQSILGRAYVERRSGGDENFERAVRALSSALTVYRREDFPEEWAEAQKQLGLAYFFRVRGGSVENKEKAIEHFKQALSVWTYRSSPVEWAELQNLLGMAYSARLLGDEKENLKQSFEAYQAAIGVFRREEFPARWAYVQMNLGITYLAMSEYEEPEQSIERGIQCLEAALEVLDEARETEVLAAQHWADAQSNLGTAYGMRMRGEKAGNLERAIRAAEAALTVYHEQNYMGRYGLTLVNLSNFLTKRIHGDRRENLERAVAALKLANSLESTMSKVILDSLGNVYVELHRWEEAYGAFHEALRSSEAHYAYGLTEEDKRAEIEFNQWLYQRLVDVCLRFEPPRVREAFLYAEKGRSRLLRDQLGALTLPPPRGVPQDLITKESQLIQRWRHLENTIRAATEERLRREKVDEAEAVRAQLNELWEIMLLKHGAEDYVAIRRGSRVEWDEIRSWLAERVSGAALLEFLSLEDDLICFIVRADEAEPQVVRLKISARQLTEWVERLVSEVHRFDAEFLYAETWHGLSSPLLRDVMPHLEGTRLLYIVPHGSTHYLPLHALEYEGQPLIQYFPIVYAPSVSVAMRMSMLDRSRPLSEARGDERCLVVGNPTGDLPLAEEEAKEVARRFNVRPLLGPEATKERVQSELTNAFQGHFAAHAFFAPSDPFASGIVLAGNSTLTARDVSAHSLNLELMVLSACQTAVQDIQPGDELVGLARAFLYAGVPSLIVSLWTVDDTVTKDFMVRFYDLLYDEKGEKRADMADALRKAMLEIRALSPHTYHWAPFILFGNAR